MIVPVLLALAVLTVIYFIISAWSRSVRKEKLEDEWDHEIREGNRDAFIEQGLKEYDRSLRRKLILGVYVIPLVFILVMIYVVNFM